jgi:hypothetical protein
VAAPLEERHFVPGGARSKKGALRLRSVRLRRTRRSRPAALKAKTGSLKARFFWKLCAMPHRNDPNGIIFDSIEKSVWRYDYFPISKLWKLRYDSPGFRKVFEPS